MQSYPVKKLEPPQGVLTLSVPASKSLLNRALVLAAFTEGDTHLVCGSFGEDSEALLRCLHALGIEVERTGQGLLVHGKGVIPNQTARLDVGSAGTAARFLTAVLAHRGGNYEMHASPQMTKRPMEIIPPLQALGVAFEFLGEENHFPFRMCSHGFTAQQIEVDTDTSTQYASGLMLAAALGKQTFSIALKGGRTGGSYVRMTAELIERFGGRCIRSGYGFEISPVKKAPKEFVVEPDVSAACYFYALALLLRMRVLVPNVHLSSGQGDIRFLALLREKGVTLSETAEGVLLNGRNVDTYRGFDVDLQDFSDQALTVAALAMFASSPSVLKNLGHIRRQECDRVQAIVQNVNSLGGRAYARGDDIFIEPAAVTGGTVATFDDHRVAMAFALAGLKTGNVTIDNPACCRKTFGEYFDILDKLTR